MKTIRIKHNRIKHKMLADKIQKEITAAMKAKDEVRLSTLKMLSSALHNALIDKKREALSEEEEMKVVRSEAKKRKDAIEMYKKAGVADRVEREQKELKILEEYLPEKLSEDELEKIIGEAIESLGAKSVSDVGKVIGRVMQKAGGQADGKEVAEKVRSALS
jgi:uncharacterized protein YqeY